jgi:spore maturation protein CgeB
MSTYDVAVGYEEALKQLGHDVKCFAYHNAISFYQLAVDTWCKVNPKFKPGQSAHLALASEHVVIEAVDFVPDVVVVVTGTALHRRAYELIHRLNLPIAIILTESPYSDMIQSEILTHGHVSFAFTNEANSVAPLSETKVPTTYLPHSYRPDIHRVRGVINSYETDVFFHGTLFPERKEMFAPLAELPYNTHVGGPDPSYAIKDDISEEDLEEIEESILSNRELSFHYNSTKIALNLNRQFIGTRDGETISVGDDVYSLGPRAFEIAACGAFQLCDGARGELKDVFGESVPIYKSSKDLVDKVNYFMKHDAEREELAALAHEAVEDCTFEARARDIIIPCLEKVL